MEFDIEARDIQDDLTGGDSKSWAYMLLIE
jgi:hypothetical protein